MMERKFLYKNPKNSSERLEAIHEEFCLTSTKDLDRISTVKDLVKELLLHSKNMEWKSKRREESERLSVKVALGILCTIAIVLIISTRGDSQDWQWFSNHQFSISLWGTALATVYVGISLEQTSFFKVLWNFGFTKIIVSLALSALIIFCTGKASGKINLIFGVDASTFPLTRAIISAILAFQYIYPLLIVVALFAVVHALNLYGFMRSKLKSDDAAIEAPWSSLAFLFLSMVVLGFSWRWVHRDFSEAALPAKIYMLAHTLDFNLRHSCTNLRPDVAVVFIGSNQSMALVDANHIVADDIRSFVERRFSDDVSVPAKFLILPCQRDDQSESTVSESDVEETPIR